MKNYAIILASGTGERSGLEIPKQFVKIAGKTVLEHTINCFQYHSNIDNIIIVTHKNYINFVKELVNKNNFNKVSSIIEGGNTRKDSSFCGISAIREENAKVLIHDSVRPFISARIINDCIIALDKYKAVDVAIPSADTIIEINDSKTINKIPQRKFLQRGQTPQAFDLKTIKKAHEMAQLDSQISVTDDCSLVLKYNLSEVFVVNGDESNIKITYPIDISIADKLFQLKTCANITRDLKALKDKVLIVFGGNSGIGASIVQIAKSIGAKVYSFSRKNNIDITSPKNVEKALKEVFNNEKKIDYVINTAGILKYGEINKRSFEDIKNEVSTNYIGSINIAKASFEYLKKTSGTLLLYSSSSYTRGRKNYSIYSSSKAAIVNLAQALAEEWEEDKVKVNVIVPERTATPMRFNNFGEEPIDTLLDPDFVATQSLGSLLQNITGQVFSIKK